MYKQIVTDRAAPVQFIPHIRSTTDISSYEFKDSENHHQWPRLLYKEKSFFSTSSGNLGTATAATKKDDENGS